MRSPRRLAVVAFVLSTLLLPRWTGAAETTSGQVSRATRQYQSGLHALRAGNLAKARASFEAALKLLPYFPEAHMGMGHVAMGEKRFADALASYRSAVDGYGKIGDTLYDFQVRRYADAQHHALEIRDLMNNVRLAVATGRMDARRGEIELLKLEEALRELEAMQPPRPDESHEPPGETFFHIGNAYFNLNRLHDAIRAWEQCAGKTERFSLVHNNLAVGYWKTGRLDEAHASLARAEKLGFPVNPAFKADLAQTPAASR